MSKIAQIIAHLKLRTKIPEKEFCGPCPLCGGKDRFLLFPDESRTGGYRWYCRQCGKKGDAIDLYRDMHGVTYLKACEELGIEKHGECKKETWQKKKSSPPARLFPDVSWRQQARNFMRRCQTIFYANVQNSVALPESASLDLVAGRDLTPSTCLKLCIGYNDYLAYQPRNLWGLEWNETRTKLCLPRGIVIGIRRKNLGIISLVIRCRDEDIRAGRPKYWEIAGGARNYPYACGQSGLPLVLCESALDAALIWQYGQRNFAAMALMGAAKKLDSEAVAFIKAAPAVVVAYDRDETGREAAIRLENMFGAISFPPVEAKDLGEMHKLHCQNKGGMHIGEWLGEVKNRLDL